MSSELNSLRPTVFDTAVELDRALADEIADGIADAATAGRRYVLGCPGGRSARGTYLALAERVHERRLPLGHLVIAMMDDYVVAAGDSYVQVPADAHYSCRRFAYEEIVTPLNDARVVSEGVSPERVVFPDPRHPEVYDTLLASFGGIDLFILASGASDGHVAFNPPGTPLTATSRIVPLADTTRTDNLGTFPDFHDINEVPRFGVSVGPATIRDLSRRVVMVIHGAHKRQAAARVLAATGYESDWPATVVVCCQRPAVYVDRAAFPAG